LRPGLLSFKPALSFLGLCRGWHAQSFKEEDDGLADRKGERDEQGHKRRGSRVEEIAFQYFKRGGRGVNRRVK